MTKKIDAQRKREQAFRENVKSFLEEGYDNALLGGRPLLVLRHDTGELIQLVTELRGNVLYRFYDAGLNLLYIGMTRDLQMRCNGAKSWGPRAGHRNRIWWPQVCLVTVDGTATTREQLAQRETVAIRNESPKYNIVDQFHSRVQVTYRNGHRIYGETL